MAIKEIDPQVAAQDVERWISRSVRQNETVEVPAALVTATHLDALECAKDDGVWNNGWEEYWGATDAGHAWRIHIWIG